MMMVVVVRAMEGSGGHFGFGVDCGAPSLVV